MFKSLCPIRWPQEKLSDDGSYRMKSDRRKTNFKSTQKKAFYGAFVTEWERQTAPNSHKTKPIRFVLAFGIFSSIACRSRLSLPPLLRQKYSNLFVYSRCALGLLFFLQCWFKMMMLAYHSRAAVPRATWMRRAAEIVLFLFSWYGDMGILFCCGALYRKHVHIQRSCLVDSKPQDVTGWMFSTKLLSSLISRPV